MIVKQGKYLITTNNFFFAPDGKQYRAAWGEVVVGSFKDEFGFENSGPQHAKWFAKIGNDEKGILVAGCQIHYACLCPSKPNTSTYEEMPGYSKKRAGVGETEVHEEFNVHVNRIYIAE